MNWRKHILIGAIGLNCVLYLGTALWLAVINTQHTKNELARYATLTSEILDIEIKRARRISGDIIMMYLEKKYPMDTQIFWPSSSMLKIASLGIIKNDSVDPILPLNHKPSIPQLLIKEHDYELVYFDREQHTYLSLTMEPNDYQLKDSSSTDHFIASYQFDLAKWIEGIRSVNQDVAVSIIEQNELMEPLTLYTNLKESLLPQLLSQSPLQDDKSYDTLRALGRSGQRDNTVFIATLSGMKYVVLPVVLSSKPEAKQVIYYSLPLPQFASISLETVFVIVASLFTTLVALLLSGFYLVKHLDKHQK